MKRQLVSLLAIAVAWGGGEPVSAETLREAMAAAYLSNPTLEAERAALRATDEQVEQARAGFLPNVNAQASVSRAERVDNTVNPGDTVNLGGGFTGVVDDDNNITLPDGSVVSANSVVSTNEFYQAQLTQNIFNGFQDQNATNAAKSQVYAGRAQLRQVEQTTLSDTVTAYMDVVRDEAVVRLNENNVRVLERQLQASRDRFAVGEVTRTDVAQSEARLEGARAQLLNAEAQLAASRAAYERVVGRPAGTLETPDEMPSLPASLESAIETAVSNAPRIAQARESEESARYDVKQAEGALLPSLDVNASWQRQKGTSTFVSGLDVTNRQVGLQLSIPLYQGGARYADIRRLKEVRSQRMLQIREAERLVRERVLAAWDNYRAAKGRINATEAQVRAGEVALDGVRQEAAVGSRTTLDVLDQEQELLNARVELVTAQRDEMVAAYNLMAAVGKLTASDLGLNVQGYDPNEHYEDSSWSLIGW
ncbi:TolC family outer membrane protein [Yunchengibacter salinarum]|uniref:TolC family outer membrane protein n=1 Tax=Yunchengibacter salinarum TaxID=3133399 RepID=UPI0035B62795